MMPGSAQYKMDQLVSLMMAEDKIEPSEQFVAVLKTLDPAEVIINLIYVPYSVIVQTNSIYKSHRKFEM